MSVHKNISMWAVKFPLKIKKTGEIVRSPADFYASNHWRNIKRWYARKHAYKCRICGKKKGLHLHHLSYRRIDKYKPKNYCYLCERHHQKYHKLVNECRRSDYYYSANRILKLTKAKKPKVI